MEKTKNMIEQQYIDKAKEDFKELYEKVNGKPYELIHIIYYPNMTHDEIVMTDRNGGRSKGFDLNYKSIAVTIKNEDGFAELSGYGVEVYRSDGYLLGTVNMNRLLKDEPKG